MFPADEVVPPGVNGMLVRSLGWVQLPQEKEKMLGDVASALDSLGVAYEVVRGELSHVVWVAGSAPGSGASPTTTNPATKSDGEGGGSCTGSCTNSCSASAAPVAVSSAEGGGGRRVDPDGLGGSAGAATTSPRCSVQVGGASSSRSSEAGTSSCAAAGGGAGGVAASEATAQASLLGPSSAPRGGEDRPGFAGEGFYSEGQLCVRLRVVPDPHEKKSQLHIDRQAGDVLQFHSFYRDVRNQLAGANGWVNNKGKYEHNVVSS